MRLHGFNLKTLFEDLTAKFDFLSAWTYSAANRHTKKGREWRKFILNVTLGLNPVYSRCPFDCFQTSVCYNISKHKNPSYGVVLDWTSKQTDIVQQWAHHRGLNKTVRERCIANFIPQSRSRFVLFIEQRCSLCWILVFYPLVKIILM